MVCGAQLLGALPCEVDLVVVFVGEDRGLESGVLPVGEAFRVGVQDRADPVERVVCAAAVAVDGLLHPPANLVDGLGAEFDDVERVQHRGRVVELVVDGVLIAVEPDLAHVWCFWCWLGVLVGVVCTDRGCFSLLG